MTSECGSESSERGRKVTRLEVADADGDEEPKLLVGMEDGTVQIVNALTGEPKARSSASGAAIVGFYRDGEDLLVLHANGQVDLLKAGSTAMSAPEYLIDARDWNGRETARLVVRAIPETTRAEAWGGQVSVEGGGFIELRVRSREGRASAPGVTVDGAGFAVEAGQPMHDIAMELTEVAASPNNGWMYILSHDGEELTRFQGTAGYAVLDGLQALDVDGDGRRTVFSFSASGSFGYGWDCELDGTSTRFNTDGWPSQLRDAAMVDFAGDGGVASHMERAGATPTTASRLMECWTTARSSRRAQGSAPSRASAARASRGWWRSGSRCPTSVSSTPTVSSSGARPLAPRSRISSSPPATARCSSSAPPAAWCCSSTMRAGSSAGSSRATASPSSRKATGECWPPGQTAWCGLFE